MSSFDGSGKTYSGTLRYNETLQRWEFHIDRTTIEHCGYDFIEGEVDEGLATDDKDTIYARGQWGIDLLEKVAFT